MFCIINFCTFAFALILLFECNFIIPNDNIPPCHKCEVFIQSLECVSPLVVFERVTVYFPELCRDLLIDPG